MHEVVIDEMHLRPCICRNAGERLWTRALPAWSCAMNVACGMEDLISSLLKMTSSAYSINA